MDDIKKLKDFNFDESFPNIPVEPFPTIPESNLQELYEQMRHNDIASLASNIEKIDLQQLADFLGISSHTITTNHAGMLINIFEHPIIGWATTIQASGDGALLIKRL
jgi:hypothetical protein